VARRRDVRQSEKGLDVSLSRRGFTREHPGISPQPHQKCVTRPNASSQKRLLRPIPANLVSSQWIKTQPIPKLGSELKAEEIIPASCELRQSTYLNNLIEQDHRFLKRLVKLGMGFFSFETAWRTLHGYEAMNMIRKGQMHGVDKGDILNQLTFIAGLFGVAS
jgi:hypothetical protein